MVISCDPNEPGTVKGPPFTGCVNISDDNKSLCKHWPVSIRDAQKKDDAKCRKHKVEEGIFGKDIQFTSEHIQNLIK